MRKYWTKEMLEYIKSNYANESSKSIAERFDIELTAVYNKAFVLGLKKGFRINLWRGYENDYDCNWTDAISICCSRKE
jgi:hypothetical protein